MNTQRGNILFIILLAVVLFAALTYAVNGGFRVSQDQNIPKEKARAIAAEIINYATLMEQTVNRLRVNGCTPTQISFENTVETTYFNNLSPIDKSCNVFDKAGGGMAWKIPDASWLISSADAAGFAYVGADLGKFNIPLNVCVDGLSRPCNGSDAASKQIILGLKWLRKDVCEAINLSLGNTSVDYVNAQACSQSGDTGRHTGVFPATGIFTCGASTYGKRSGCIYSSRSGYSFYHVLLTQ